ncbi:MAG: transposase [Magnetococcales bacterium]|nr:transposase [Magnetococcales bacterium]
MSLLSDMLGVEMALGSVSGCEKAVSQALSGLVEEAGRFARSQHEANADETSWRESKKRVWLWVMVTSLVTVFMIHASRGKKAANRLLEGFCGVLITDRWGGQRLAPGTTAVLLGASDAGIPGHVRA